MIVETYVITYSETKNILYVGQNLDEANKWLEMPHYSKEEQEKYKMSIWFNDSLVNESITKKIIREPVPRYRINEDSTTRIN